MAQLSSRYQISWESNQTDHGASKASGSRGRSCLPQSSPTDDMASVRLEISMCSCFTRLIQAPTLCPSIVTQSTIVAAGCSYHSSTWKLQKHGHMSSHCMAGLWWQDSNRSRQETSWQDDPVHKQIHNHRDISGSQYSLTRPLTRWQSSKHLRASWTAFLSSGSHLSLTTFSCSPANLRQ